MSEKLAVFRNFSSSTFFNKVVVIHRAGENGFFLFYCLTLGEVGSINRSIDSGGAAGGGAVRPEIQGTDGIRKRVLGVF